jgi:hypothetical protein
MRTPLACAAVALLALAGIPEAAQAADLPIEPRALVVPRSQVPGFARSKRWLEVAVTPGQWAKGILEDTPANGEEEERRLIDEGFREGVVEDLESRGAGAFSAALLLGSPEGAANEASHKASEELAELGKGASRFTVTAVPGAVGVQQTHTKHARDRGHYEVAVLFSEADCFASVGAVMRSYPAARRASLAGAAALASRLRPSCG